MGRPNKVYLPGVVYEVTSRTVAGSFVLRPSAESDELMLGVIGRGQFLYPSVKIYALNPLSSHTTELLSSDDPEELVRFIGFVKSNISRELTKHYGLRFGVFDRNRVHTIAVAPDQASLESRLNYVLSQGTKEDLVESPRDWDGVSGLGALEEGEQLEGVWFDRTAEGIARRKDETFDKYEYATTYPVVLSPLPCWDDSNTKWRKRVSQIVDGIEIEAKLRHKADKTTVFGMENVRAYPPTYVPPTVKRSPAPPVLAATKRVFDAFKSVFDLLREEFREAAWQLKAGIEQVVFPPFCFPSRSPMTSGDPNILNSLFLLNQN